MGFAAFTLPLVAATSLHFAGSMSFLESHRLWCGASALAPVALAWAWWIFELRHRRRESALEMALIERTQALDRERLIERERNRILEMLVSNEPLGTVLDSIARLIRSQCPRALCAVLMKRGDGCHVASGPDLPREWLAALRTPHAVPFEIWRNPSENQQPDRNPAWRTFIASLEGPAPAAVYSWPIGNAGESVGALLLCYREAAGPGECDTQIAEAGERMACLAIEHSHRYDDLHFHAHHDNLTGLPNRVLFDERLDRCLREAGVLGRQLAVLCIDLDNFKQVNDQHSRRAGDALLREVAGRIKSQLRPGDTVARIGGDQFAVVLHNVEDTSEAREMAERVLEAIRGPVVVDGFPIASRASAGIAIFPGDGKDSEQLQRAVSAATRHARNLGGDRAEAFATRNETLDRVRMDEEIRLGLSQGYFVIYYQPKVGSDRKVVGFEALVRMNHPSLGLVPPMSFIPVAEENGLIVPLGAWVLEEVCRQVSEWQSRGLGLIPVAVNVSPVQICRPDFAQSVADCLGRYAIPAANLELELTESLLISATGVAQEQLQALRELGVKLSIDDFGTGYSSLSYLHRLRIDAIKLDRSFVQSIDTDLLARRLVQAMIGVAQGLGLAVVAEGVETESQRDALIASGCPQMQGFLFARPQPAGELDDFLRTTALEDSASGAAPFTDDLMHIAASLGVPEGCTAGAVLTGSSAFGA